MHMHTYMHTEHPMWEEGCCRQDEGVCGEAKGQKSKGLGGWWRDDALLRVSPRRRQTPLKSGRRPGRRGGTWRLVATRHSWGSWRVHSSSPQADVWSSTGNRKLIHSERPSIHNNNKVTAYLESSSDTRGFGLDESPLLCLFLKLFDLKQDSVFTAGRDSVGK